MVTYTCYTSGWQTAGLPRVRLFPKVDFSSLDILGAGLALHLHVCCCWHNCILRLSLLSLRGFSVQAGLLQVYSLKSHSHNFYSAIMHLQFKSLPYVWKDRIENNFIDISVTGLCTTVTLNSLKPLKHLYNPTAFSVGKKRVFASKSDITGRTDLQGSLYSYCCKSSLFKFCQTWAVI